MRYFFGCAALLLVFAGCSSTEPVQQETEPEKTVEVEEESPVPSWYDAGVRSSTDSLEIHGFALSSAMDSARAVELSTQTALKNLRFEIDRTAEEVRTELADSDGMEEEYSSPAFIIRLRNTVSDLSLDEATMTLRHESTEKGVHYSYAKASVFRTELPGLFKNGLSEERFLQKMESVSQ